MKPGDTVFYKQDRYTVIETTIVDIYDSAVGEKAVWLGNGQVQLLRNLSLEPIEIQQAEYTGGDIEIIISKTDEGD